MAETRPLLRMSMFQMGLAVVPDARGNADGPYAYIFREFVSFYNEFNLTLVWVTDTTAAGRKVNNTYTGILRQLQMNVTDVSLIPNERSPEHEVVEFGEVITTSPVHMLSPLDVSEYDDHILSQLFRFSVDIVFLLLITMYIFSRVLNKSEGFRHSFNNLMHGMWMMSQMLVNQVLVSPVTTAGRLLVLMTVIGVFFWLQIWQNQMKMEMVSFDTSTVVRTLEEAISQNKTAVVTRSEAATLQVLQKAAFEPESPLGRLFKTVIISDKSGLKVPVVMQSVRKMSQKQFNKYVLVASDRFVSFIGGAVCAFLKSGNPHFDYLIGDEVIVDIFVGPWFSHHLNPLYKRMIRSKVTILREYGLWQPNYKVLIETMRQAADQFVPGTYCVHESLDAFMDATLDYTNKALSADQMSDIFLLLVCSTVFAGIVLLLENVGLIEAVSKKYGTVGPKTAEAMRQAVLAQRVHLGRNLNRIRLKLSKKTAAKNRQ